MCYFLAGVDEYQTLPPSEYIVQEVSVTGSAANGYDITLRSINCEPDLSMLGVYNLEVSDHSDHLIII